MNLYIFRHGHAENKSQSPDGTEEGRRLTKEGEAQVRWACARAKELGAKPTHILTSPLVRAQQTAAIANEVFAPSGSVREAACLQPEAKLADVYAALAKFKSKDSVVLVTHLPILGHLLEDLLDWNVWDRLDFDNGAIARVDTKTRPKSKAGTLVWLLPAEGTPQ